MAITDYTSLKSAIQTRANDSSADFTAELDNFIDFTEARLNQKLRVSGMVKRSTASIVAGAQYIEIPSIDDGAFYLEMIRLVIRDSQGLNFPLYQLSPVEIERVYPDDTQGQPKHFSFVGEEIRFAPVSDNSYTVEMEYFASIPPLSGSQTTNWALTKFVSLYFYGCMAEAYLFKRNDAEYERYKVLFESEIAEINRQDAKGRRPAGIRRLPDFDSGRFNIYTGE